ncbi:hypothetical protein [Nocardia terpenica]|uniref:Uncharacterized protein n=1 Tax=Nocardia terpenica TaxID=455432 RepID=A0A6G9ZDU8_9NOCA|nr:hypothetical protein [Nocardia terpenica]QIS23718.1 hypothetical protein F6W96_41000 [Nocardia terpenica]
MTDDETFTATIILSPAHALASAEFGVDLWCRPREAEQHHDWLEAAGRSWSIDTADSVATAAGYRRTSEWQFGEDDTVAAADVTRLSEDRCR